MVPVQGGLNHVDQSACRHLSNLDRRLHPRKRSCVAVVLRRCRPFPARLGSKLSTRWIGNDYGLGHPQVIWCAPVRLQLPEPSGRRMARLKIFLAVTSCAAVLMGFNGLNIVQKSPAGSNYDFVVHVKNIPTYRYNPEVSNDRAELTLRLTRRYCKGPRVVGQRTIDTEIYGITSEKPDYAVFVRCSSG